MSISRVAGITATAVLSVAPVLWAHGGTYRGPGDTVPSQPGGGGGKTPSPSGPSTPGPSGPSTPGPSGPSTPGPGPAAGPATGGGPRSGPTTGKGIELGEDLTKWEYWWEFNKDPYINLKRAIHTGGPATGSDDYFIGKGTKLDAENLLRPSQKDILNKVVPKLIDALKESKQRDITSSCLVALAKIGLEEDKVLPLMKERLPDGDQEVSETAALAMGIMANTKAIDDLIKIATDSPAGRELCKRPNGISFRTRSFAAYGLGLIAYSTKDVEVKSKCFDTLKGILADDRSSQRDVRIAAINGMRLLRVEPSEGEKAQGLYNSVIESLMAFYDAKKSNEEQSQAHVPTAIAKLVGRELDSKGVFKKRFVDDLENTKKSDWIRQSCAMALGSMAKAEEDDYTKALQDYARKGKDAQARYFSLIACGQVGGEKNRTFLIGQVEDAKKIEKAWAALALGIMNFNLRLTDRNAEIDRAAGQVIADQLRKNKNPEVQAGLCVALGLLGYTEGADDVLEVLHKQAKDDTTAGYACLGLGLMRHKPATNEIKTVVEDSLRRPERLKQAAIALGLLGDKSASDILVKFLKEKMSSLAATSAVASALGFIGDSRSLDPLTEMLFNKDLSDIARAFAAVALGIVADKEEYPWNSKIAVNINYRANTETLTSKEGGNGILDIL